MNAGQGLYPVAYLPAASTMEMQLTSGQFDSSLFSLANGGDFEAAGSYKVPVTKILPVQSDKVTLQGCTTNIDAADVLINGMDRVTTTPASTGKYLVTTTSSGGVYTSEVTFYDGDFDDGAMVEVTWYETKTNGLKLDVSNDKAAVGEAIFVWPVYNGGENIEQGTGTFSAQDYKGYIVLDVYRCRITQVPGFDTSYKTNATNSITLSTMDPENSGHGRNAWNMVYLPNV